MALPDLVVDSSVVSLPTFSRINISLGDFSDSPDYWPEVDDWRSPYGHEYHLSDTMGFPPDKEYWPLSMYCNQLGCEEENLLVTVEEFEEFDGLIGAIYSKGKLLSHSYFVYQSSNFTTQTTWSKHVFNGALVIVELVENQVYNTYVARKNVERLCQRPSSL